MALRMEVVDSLGRLWREVVNHRGAVVPVLANFTD
jgi:hypothetical protein